MIIYIDMDGVLCDFHKGILDTHNKSDPYYNPDNLGKYGLHKLLNMHYMDMMGSLGIDFWANLQPTPWCFDLMALCEKLSSDIYLLTAPADNVSCLTGKGLWIEKHLPKMKRKYFIGKDKQMLAHSHTILIDDKSTNIKDFNKFGGHGILVPQPWNELYEMNTWEYLKETIPYVYNYWENI